MVSMKMLDKSNSRVQECICERVFDGSSSGHGDDIQAMMKDRVDQHKVSPP